MHVLKLKAVAEKLNVHPNTIYSWVKDQGFPKSFLIGGIPVWDEADVDGWLQQQKEKQYGNNGETQGEVAGANV